MDQLPLRKAGHDSEGRDEENIHYKALLQGFHSGVRFLLCDLLGCITEGLILQGISMKEGEGHLPSASIRPRYKDN